jgi:VCBS repeat-containing protein
MAASTTVKVATQTGAAKDDTFLSSVTEDMLKAKLAVLDNDPGAAKLYSLVPLAGMASTTQVPVVSQGLSARGAQISINADGTINYDASGIAASLQSLAVGQSATDTFEYIVRMANGALSTAKVTVSIGGVNDAPTLQSVAAVSILDTAADDTPAAIVGALSGNDVDNGAVLTYSVVSGSSAYGTLTLGSNGQYSFNADADKIDALGAGVNASATFVVNVKDEQGAASAPVTLQFNLLGANDTAAISGNGAGAATEDGAGTAAGVLAVSDRDSGESVFAVPAALAGTYGDFSFDAATGAWAYALRNGATNVQALNAGKVVQDSVTVSSIDGTATQTISMDITGSNDLAVISGTASGSVAEDGVQTASGALTITDVDTGEAVFGATTVNAAYGDFTFDAGNWTYLLRNSSAAVQALNANQTVFDTMTVASRDGSASQVISVAIQGAAEAVPPSQLPPPNPVDVYMITYGGGKANVGMNSAKLDSNVITGFDSNDVLRYAANLTAVVEVVNNDTVVHFAHNGNTFDITLIGITNVSASQILATNA